MQSSALPSAPFSSVPDDSSTPASVLHFQRLAAPQPSPDSSYILSV